MDNNSFKLVCLHVGKKCHERISKNLGKNRYFFFCLDYEINDEGKVAKKKDCIDPGNLYGNNITISGIVGRNGAGKSSVLELLYRSFFLIGQFLSKKEAKEDVSKVEIIKGLDVSIYFEFNYILYRCDINKEKHISFEPSADSLPKVLLYASNFSLLSLTPPDFKDEIPHWIDTIYGNETNEDVAVKIFPPRGKRTFASADYRLITSRQIALLFINSWANGPVTNNNNDFKYDHLEIYNMFDQEELPKIKDNESRNFVITTYFDYLKPSKEFIDNLTKTTLSIFYKQYLLYLTLKGVFHEASISDFNNRIKQNQTFSIEEKYQIESYIKGINENKTFDAIYIKQFLSFLNVAHLFNEKQKRINWDEYLKAITMNSGLKGKSISEIFELFPPSFFRINLFVKQETQNSVRNFETLSSGERQMYYNLAGPLYQLISYLQVLDKKAHAEVLHANLIMTFDEIEMFFHPEYQRQFISYLTNILQFYQINEHFNIHILLATHSPYILSDIPSSSILCLNDGKQEIDELENTFGANIHDMLKNRFFLDSTIGLIAQKNINDLIDEYHDYLNLGDCKTERNKYWDEYAKKRDHYSYVANIVADEYLRKLLKSICNQLDYKYYQYHAQD